jgi:hypothetical protein
MGQRRYHRCLLRKGGPDSYAGLSTTADVAIRLIADFRLGVVLPYLLTGGAVGYGLHQRRLRRAAIERLTNRTQQLELQRDPNRTTSALTSRGTTNPKDR